VSLEEEQLCLVWYELTTELADMRARFDDDRRKVDELKRQRRFKPY
jgi:predicted  nucleic acid-binding Zn-ribbon protein